MTSANLQQWIQHPQTLNRDTLYELRMLVSRYPYFQSLRLLYLKNLYLLHDITFGAELRKATLYVSDRRVLFYLIEGDKYTLEVHKKATLFAETFEEEPSLDRTLNLIHAFLSTVPQEPATQSELDYATDYTAYLIQENEEASIEQNTETTPKLRGHEMIDGFIQKSEKEPSLRLKPLDQKESPSQAVEELLLQEEEEEDSCFTDTLAKIYIKQQRYAKALEIIKKLSLKYPKKNAYFADQIRFLEKLIINNKSK